MNKKERLELIQDLVVRYPIDTQDEIVERLKDFGVQATQATVSRDIKELGIIKVPTADNTYIYGLPKPKQKLPETKSILDLRSMDKMIHIDLVPGSALVIKRQILEQFGDQIFSVIADDDSILLIVKGEDYLPQIQQTIRMW
ncbi:arginine repressor [Streptococcus suis]|nr:arginine repressor [Streptococcus suis]